MRPIQLNIKAFGPYAGEISIPMDQLGTQGLYLITGDTGAGKTTIFDAICYALYGEASGNSRETSMFRSKYADADTPTEVELIFLHGGKEYRVSRVPEYMRPAKRGDKEIKQVAGAYLYLPDGTVVSKIREVTAEIERILGINREQFSQIAMLAQGDFMKLLLADTKQRQEIFRELFKTGYYQRLQYALDDRRKEIYGKAEDGKKSIKQYISGIAVDEDDVLAIDVRKAISGEMITEEIIELLDKLTGQDSALRDKLDNDLESINGELEQVNKKLGAAENLENAKKNLVALEAKLEDALPLEKALKDALEKVKKNLEGKDQLTRDAAAIESALPDYDTLNQYLKDVTSNEKKLKESKATLLEKEEFIATKTKELEELKAEQLTLKGTGAMLERLISEQKDVHTRISELEELEKEHSAIESEKKQLIKAQEKYAKDSAAFTELQHSYEVMDQAFRDGQAGILAAALVEGQKCPVCGSTSHPHKASIAADVPSEMELKDAKEAAEAAREKATASSNAAQKIRTEIETKEEAYEKNSKKLLGEDSLEHAKEKAEELSANIEEQIRVEKAKKSRSEELERLVPSVEELCGSEAAMVSDIKASISALESTMKGLEVHIAGLRDKLKFESREAAVAKMEELHSSASALQSEYERAEKAAREKSDEVISIKSEIDGHKKSLENVEEVDLAAEREKKVVLEERQDATIKSAQIVTARINTNEEVRTNIERQSANMAEIEKQLQWVSALSDTANGKLKGKEKIMLETYIQTTYFDRIIERANLRFMTMSGGQYELKRLGEATNTKSQSGLELGVIDHYNGTERSVKTLSGGESFMASLSLALGLSDEVQSSAGGIQIDTMFVDEGFGSLDGEALQQAYKALQQLTDGNRLVGIISHVSELKEMIDSKIIVTKEKSGGSFARLCI